MTSIFSYGTLQEEHIQMALFGRVLDTSVDCLIGYVTLNDYFGYPRLKKLDNGIVYGRVLELDDNELYITDRYETQAYEKKKLITKNGVEVHAYFPTLENFKEE